MNWTRGGLAVPVGLPVLRAGAHPDPATGGCFMEYASLLAGEPWSDHPGCTHPALAQLARLVNDVLPPPARQRLAPLTPEMIGLAGHDPRVTPRDPRRVGGYGSPARRPDAVSGRWPAPVSRLAAAG